MCICVCIYLNILNHSICISAHICIFALGFREYIFLTPQTHTWLSHMKHPRRVLSAKRLVRDAPPTSYAPCPQWMPGRQQPYVRLECFIDVLHAHQALAHHSPGHFSSIGFVAWDTWEKLELWQRRGIVISFCNFSTTKFADPEKRLRFETRTLWTPRKRFFTFHRRKMAPSSGSSEGSGMRPVRWSRRTLHIETPLRDNSLKDFQNQMKTPGRFYGDWKPCNHEPRRQWDKNERSSCRGAFLVAQIFDFFSS